MVLETTPEAAKALLLRNEEQNYYPLLRLSQGGVGECWICGESVCVYDKEHNKYVYAIHRAEELELLYREVSKRGGELVSLITDAKWQESMTKIEPGILTNRCVQLRAVPFAGALPEIANVHFEAITEPVAHWILSVYEHAELSVDFIMRRISAAPNVVAMHGDTPVGFFMTHSDAELGPVYVDPAFRGSGLARALYAQMLSRYPAGTALPILFVIESNIASLTFLQRLGCYPAKESLVWFWRES